MDVTELFTQGLGLTPPWKVVAVKLDREKKRAGKWNKTRRPRPVAARLLPRTQASARRGPTGQTGSTPAPRPVLKSGMAVVHAASRCVR